MNEQQILTWTATEWLSLADFLAELAPHEWDADSLCGEWTVREVAAHLTLSTRTTVGMFAKAMIRARGNFERMEATMAKERAVRFEPAELIEQVRGNAGVTKRSPGSGLLDPLVDALVHGQDIARPLGRVRSMPIEPTRAALDYVLPSKFYGAPKRLEGVRLVATDCDWSAGTGRDEVRGPIGDILLVATGRPAGIDGLAGSAVERIGAAL